MGEVRTEGIELAVTEEKKKARQAKGKETEDKRKDMKKRKREDGLRCE